MANFYCYIIYSRSLNRFYIGETEDIDLRIDQHNSGFYKHAFTTQTQDWELFHAIKCTDRKQARLIELHIKKMKSRKYIENLKKHPEISEKLKIKYQ
ncbi:MAG: GIY-YIG nuclease family protein [Marinoscillum sp.]|uniref:GIY-YIG nuclease family protein n=1 Tax=Marinoscillum sp. TaxID=2024838 RepID=UPI0032F6CD6A